MLRFLFSLLVLSFSVPAQSALPVAFEENRGLAPADVRFIGRSADGGGLAIAASHVTLHTANAALSVKLVGARPDAPVVGQRLMAERTNYLVGNDPSRWQRDVRSFERVHVDDAYPGIDVVYYASGSNIEYDFVVAAGADPGRIRLHPAGAESIAIDPPTGDLLLTVAGGTIRQRAPHAYQDVGGRRTTVGSRYRMTQDGTIMFELEGYDRSAPLTIDPVLQFSTFLGGTKRDSVLAVATDGAGNTITAGYTESSDFMGLTATGGTNAFVAKYSPEGAVVFRTIIGGSGTDNAYTVATDAAGAIYVGGASTSSDFPLKNPFRASAVVMEGFVVKLSASGSEVAYASYFGGSGNDVVLALSLDRDGSVVACGLTDSQNLPAVNAWRSTPATGFVFRLDVTANVLIYSTYLGGTEKGDQPTSIALDAQGSAYVGGMATSFDFPLLNPVQSQRFGTSDGFVVKLSPTGAPLFSTLFGGGDQDFVGGVAATDDAVFLIGATASNDLPLKNPLTATRPSATTGFAAKLTAGGALVFSSYVGGSGTAHGIGVTTNRRGEPLFLFRVSSNDLPTVNATQPTLGGSTDAYILQLDPAGTTRRFATYFGGASVDYPYAIAYDRSGGAVAVAGFAFAPGFPLVNAAQPAIAGPSEDGFVAKIQVEAPPTKRRAVRP